jgi:hypothetical protein
MNAFSPDGGRPSRSRRSRHRRGRAGDQRDRRERSGGHAGDQSGDQNGDQRTDPYGDQRADLYGDQRGDPHGGQRVDPDNERAHSAAGYSADPRDGQVDGSVQVRPYAWTRGRTRSGFALEIETLVSTSARGREQLGVLQYEHRSVAELCEQVRSVAEVASLLGVPLGVAKVLVGDMAGLGLVVVHQTVSGNGNVPDLALMERVLSGLRRL